jgi:hypothetical protein
MAGYDEDVLAPDVCFGVYFFVDGMAERLRARQAREPRGRVAGKIRLFDGPHLLLRRTTASPLHR